MLPSRPVPFRLLQLLIAGFFLAGGIGHFIATEWFMRIMPPWLGWHRELVWISGAFEIAGAIGLLLPAWRRTAGFGLILLCLAVFPANIHMALNPEQFPAFAPALLWLRLPLQFVLIGLIAWSVRPAWHTMPRQTTGADHADT